MYLIHDFSSYLKLKCSLEQPRDGSCQATIQLWSTVDGYHEVLDLRMLRSPQGTSQGGGKNWKRTNNTLSFYPLPTPASWSRVMGTAFTLIALLISSFFLSSTIPQYLLLLFFWPTFTSTKMMSTEAAGVWVNMLSNDPYCLLLEKTCGSRNHWRSG